MIGLDTPSTTRACPSLLCKHLLVDDNILLRSGGGRRSAARWKPLEWLTLEEGPRRNYNEESEGGAGEADLEGQGDILEKVADNK